MTDAAHIRGQLRQDALSICLQAIAASLPDVAVEQATREIPFPKGKTVVISIGKAAWQMANVFHRERHGQNEETGVVITKYGHVQGPIGNYSLFEAGHPILDENSLLATEAAIEAVQGLQEDDQVILLVSGGGSALFEMPLVSLEELRDINGQLLASGADITQINTIRKRLSRVKGGRFGAMCAPAKVYALLFSDVVGDLPDMIASGPAYPDSTTSEQALALAEHLHLRLSDRVWELLHRETPKQLPHVITRIAGGVRQLCVDAEKAAQTLGYETTLLTDCLQCEACQAGQFLASVARTHAGEKKKSAYILGGETVVHITGSGVGGRNQELALAAAEGLRGLENVVIISVGSDGTDGPTDAAGGMTDGETANYLEAQGISIPNVLRENDSYHALMQCDGLVYTGPTGTNVNDVTILLLGAKAEVLT